MTTYHVPVLLRESIDGLITNKSGVYVDLTFGGGGHSRFLLEQLNSDAKVFGFDQDNDAWANAIDDSRFTFVRSNFSYIENFMQYYGVEQVDGILADLGVSSHHFDEAERGFSFRFDGVLDMRMNQSSSLTAKVILNTYDEQQLADIFFYYGELQHARKFARLIVEKRKIQQFDTIFKFVEILQPLIGREKEKKQLAQVFQALRIAVNDEMAALKKMLVSSAKMLKKEGRFVFITYHSLEDRLVKNFLKTGNIEGTIEKDFFGNIQAPFRLVNNKVIVPSDKELETNSRARSAKLRIASKK
jgi:16S rRNA (cytosine1402-N4)-methyltransferase